MIPYKEVKVLDINTEALGIPTLTLMKNAGTALAREILKAGGKGKNILFLCGTGNNGGDGLVAAAELHGHCAVRIIILGKEMRTDISRHYLYELPSSLTPVNITLDIQDWKTPLETAIKDTDIIVDSMLGVGITGDLREPFHFAVETVNRSGKTVISVDVPTGLGGSASVHPSMTVTFHDTKPGMIDSSRESKTQSQEDELDPEGRLEEGNEKKGTEQEIHKKEGIQKDEQDLERRQEDDQDEKGGQCGTIIVADIGIPADAEKFVGPGEFVYYPLPADHSHKGNNGNVLIVGGGPFTGAPALAATAALRTGSDLVFLAVPSRIYPIIASMSMDFIVRPLVSSDHLTPQDIPIILEMAKRVHAVLIGPGLGKHPDTMQAARERVAGLQEMPLSGTTQKSNDTLPLVIDADAIHALKDTELNDQVVFTPHNSEFRKFHDESELEKYSFFQTGDSRRAGFFESFTGDEYIKAIETMEAALTHGGTIVRKGAQDLITDGHWVKFNRTGNPGMTVGGTGDVLAGIIASLLARGLEPFNAGRLGAYINGRAGELAFTEKWYSLTATDVAGRIPDVFRDVF